MIEKDSRDMRAIISPGAQYSLTTSESKLSLPKTSAEIELVCQGVVIDTFRYVGNHTNDRLLTSELFDGRWYQELKSLGSELSPQLELLSLSDLSLELMRGATELADRAILDRIDQDAERLAEADATSPPVKIIWSIGAGESDEIFFADDETLVCETDTDSCQIRGQLIGLVSPGVYRFGLSQSGSLIMMSDWYTPQKDIKLDL